MSILLKCPKCQKAYPVKDESELTGKNYCADCEVELIYVAQSQPQTTSHPIPNYIANAPADVKSAYQTKPEVISKYIIVRKLGQGGMGVVYLAIDTTLNRKVALKVISSDDQEILTRFHDEAQSVAKLKHPNIIQVYEAGTIGKQHYST